MFVLSRFINPFVAGSAIAAAASLASARVATLSTLATFTGTNGSDPSDLTFDASGNLYGVTTAGGNLSPPHYPDGLGTVFKLAARSHTITNLGKFNGSAPLGKVYVDPSGNVFGVASTGGATDDGVVFRVDAGTSEINVVASFTEVTTGRAPNGVVADAAGNIYGTTNSGGSIGYGAVFKCVPSSKSLTAIGSFDDDNNGAYTRASLSFGPGGDLYGTTPQYYGGSGTVFRVPHDGTGVQTLAYFQQTDGTPVGSVAFDAHGNIFGATLNGGPIEEGSVFEVDAQTHQISTLASFDLSTGPAFSDTGVIIDAAGNLFGETSAVGVRDSDGNFSVQAGTVFRIDAITHAMTVLATFTYDDYSTPGSLIADSAGNLYGTTSGTSGLSAAGYGTIFEITGSGFVVPEPTAFAACLGMLALRRRRANSR